MKSHAVDCNMISDLHSVFSNNKGLIHAIFLDFAKAFDKVSHSILSYMVAMC